jgi:hypothetical protein
MFENAIGHARVGNHRNNLQFAAASRAEKGVNLENLSQ